MTIPHEIMHCNGWPLSSMDTLALISLFLGAVGWALIIGWFIGYTEGMKWSPSKK